MTLTLNKFRNYAMVALATMALASCSNDNFMDDTPSLKAEGMATAPEGILPGVDGSNGAWVTSSISTFFKGYYKAHGSNLPSSFALNQGDKLTKYSPGGRAFNGYYYVLNNTNTGQRGIRKMRASGSLSDVKTLQTSSGAIEGQKDEVNFTLFDATTGYYTDGQGLALGYIGKFNPTTMNTTGGITLEKSQIETKLTEAMNALNRKYKNKGDFTKVRYSDYYNAPEDSKRIGTKLLIRRGNYLYADITFGTGRNRLNQIKQNTDHIYVAVINVNSSNIEKVLIGEYARNIGLFNDHPLVNIDPISKDIYFATVGDMDKTYGTGNNAGKFSKIFRIDGTNHIQPVVSYQDVANKPTLTTVTPEGGPYKEGQFNTLYVYGGKIFTKIADRSVIYGAFNFHGQTYRNNIWQYVTFTNKYDVAKINGIPKDNFYAYQQPQLINGSLYMISNSSEGANVYKVSLGGGNPTVVTTGVAGGWGFGLASQNKISSIVKL